jgi:hypothetical protein
MQVITIPMLAIGIRAIGLSEHSLTFKGVGAKRAAGEKG